MRILRIPGLLAFIVILLEVPRSSCFLDPVSIGIGSAAGIGGLLAAGYRYARCRINECCDDRDIPIDLRELQRQLATRVYGQHIVYKTVVGALAGYKAVENPPKALVMSFHGTQGTGKNFVAGLIAQTFYRKGTNSRFYYLFSGTTFTQSRLDYHKDMIKKTILERLADCERSMFVFDEVDMMPEGLLDVISAFIDYEQPASVEHESAIVRATSNKAVFVFLSNRGSSDILDRMTQLREAGRTRKSANLRDFESAISAKAYGARGGFMNSNAIEASLVDFYVPFLPLEVQHVEACMMDAFARRTNETVTREMTEEVMSVVTYFDPPHDIYARSGCKRIEQRVITTVFQPDLG